MKNLGEVLFQSNGLRQRLKSWATQQHAATLQVGLVATEVKTMKLQPQRVQFLEDPTLLVCPDRQSLLRHWRYS